MGEVVALLSLLRQGMTFAERNWRCRLGELDLVLLEGDELVSVEVKTRAGDASYLNDTISPQKAKRLRRLTEAYVLFRYGRRRRVPHHRIDVVIVHCHGRAGWRRFTVKHMTAAV